MDYKNKKWERKREVILGRDDYSCQESKRYGKRVDAVTVHHIYPVEFYPELLDKDLMAEKLKQEAEEKAETVEVEEAV